MSKISVEKAYVSGKLKHGFDLDVDQAILDCIYAAEQKATIEPAAFKRAWNMFIIVITRAFPNICADNLVRLFKVMTTCSVASLRQQLFLRKLIAAIDGNNPNRIEELGDTLFQSKKFDLAIEYYTIAAELHTRSSTQVLERSAGQFVAALHVKIAECHFEKQDYEEGLLHAIEAHSIMNINEVNDPAIDRVTVRLLTALGWHATTSQTQQKKN